jgi:hypothetical protein
LLDKKQFKKMLVEGRYHEIANIAIKIESRTNLLFSFEKMAIRDAVKPLYGAKLFANGLYQMIYGKGTVQEKILNFAEVLSFLPRKQTRVVTWPLLTVFGFIADPSKFIFLKPRVTQLAAERYGFDFHYSSKPNWETYSSLLEFAEVVRIENSDLKPKDMIDLQSFIWVMGSDEYE